MLQNIDTVLFKIAPAESFRNPKKEKPYSCNKHEFSSNYKDDYYPKIIFLQRSTFSGIKMTNSSSEAGVGATQSRPFCLEPTPSARSRSRLPDLRHPEPKLLNKVATPQHCFTPKMINFHFGNSFPFLFHLHSSAIVLLQ